MKNSVSVTVAEILALILPAPGQAETLESQFDRFLSWWPGTYDNAAQIDPEQQSGATGAVPMLSTRLHIKAVDHPAFGDHVVYAEWQAIDDPSKILRQRFYGFEIDQDRKSLRLNLFIFPTDPTFVARTRGAHLDPTRIADLTPSDMVPLPNCDVFFTWTGEHFEGAMDKGACAFPAPGTTDDIYSWSQMRLSSGSFEYLDGWFNPDGTMYARLSEDWYAFERR
jgi:hypothetical protein